MISELRIPMRQINGYFLRWYYNGWHYWQFFTGTLGYKTEGIKYRTTGTRTIELSSGVLNYEQVEAIRSILNTVEVYLYTDGGWAEIRLDSGSVPVLKNELQAYEVTIKANLGSRHTETSPVRLIPIIPQRTYCEIVIGTQTWMCANWGDPYPGSKIMIDETSRETLGGLYRYGQAMNPGFCPEGWHIPTVAEWQTLIDFVGGASVAGGKLKKVNLFMPNEQSTFWQAPSVGATDEYDFTAWGSGYIEGKTKIDFKLKARFWTAAGTYLQLTYDSAAAEFFEEIEEGTIYNPIPHYYSVRMIKDYTALPPAWAEQTSPVLSSVLYSISAIDSNNAWAVGYDGDENLLILHTSNGGTTWTEQDVSILSSVLISVCFIDANNGWACGYDTNQIILHTLDGGTNWTEQTSPVATGFLYCIFFTDVNNGWATGDDGSGNIVILHTSDSGVNWIEQTSPITTGAINGIHFIDANNGWAVGDDGVGNVIILVTTNGGTTWIDQLPVLVGSLINVFFVDANNGWAVGYDDLNTELIVHTSNGGATWVEQTVPAFGGTIYNVNFVNASIGWAVGYNGINNILLSTLDGGVTWTEEVIPVTTSALYGLSFLGTNVGWIVGENVNNIVILKYS